MVYQAGNGQWIVLIDETKTYFNTETEARNMASKISYVEDVQDFSTRLAALFNEAPDFEAIYFDRGYNGGGSDPIIDADLSGLGVTAAQVSLFITLAQQLQNFANNVAMVQGDYSATINALRTDK